MKLLCVRVILVLEILAGISVAAAFLLMNDNDRQEMVSGEVLVADAAFPAALAPLEEGGLLYGERLSGRIRRVDPDGRLRSQPVAAVDVSTEGQRDLLGVAAGDRGRVFASWTRPDGRLVVGRLDPGPRRLLVRVVRTCRCSWRSQSACGRLLGWIATRLG